MDNFDGDGPHITDQVKRTRNSVRRATEGPRRKRGRRDDNNNNSNSKLV